MQGVVESYIVRSTSGPDRFEVEFNFTLGPVPGSQGFVYMTDAVLLRAGHTNAVIRDAIAAKIEDAASALNFTVPRSDMVLPVFQNGA